jgi:hypothetical protein
MDVILVHSHYDAAHLAAVQAEMLTLGAPAIRGVFFEEGCDVWVALEGCHRLRAAHALGLMPTMIEVEYDDTTTTEDIGIYHQDNLTIVELLARHIDNDQILCFEEDVLIFV